MNLRAFEIAEITRGTLVGDPNRTALYAVCDTRRLEAAGGLFAAFQGERTDGHEHLANAALRGAVVALVDRGRVSELDGHGMTLVGVEDVQTALWDLAAHVRSSFDHPVCEITGSVGKTTVKNMVAAILGKGVGPGCVTFGNENNFLGTPMTLLRLDARNHRYMVVEAGSNAPGEIEALSGLVRPQIGVVTAVREAHLEGFGSVMGVLQEKMALPRSIPAAGVAVLPSYDALIMSATRDLHCEIVTFGYEEEDFVRIVSENEGDRASGTLLVEGEEVEIVLPVAGVFNLRNAAAAVAVGTLLGVSPWVAAEALATFERAPLRMELRGGPRGSRFVVDAYNASPSSMQVALETVAAMRSGRRIAVLGGMYEMGPDARRLHVEVGEMALKLGFELVGVGERGEWLAGEGRGRVLASHQEAADWLSREVDDQTVVLLKGSRRAKMEMVHDLLTKAVS